MTTDSYGRWNRFAKPLPPVRGLSRRCFTLEIFICYVMTTTRRLTVTAKFKLVFRRARVRLTRIGRHRGSACVRGVHQMPRTDLSSRLRSTRTRTRLLQPSIGVGVSRRKMAISRWRQRSIRKSTSAFGIIITDRSRGSAQASSTLEPILRITQFSTTCRQSAECRT